MIRDLRKARFFNSDQRKSIYKLINRCEDRLISWSLSISLPFSLCELSTSIISSLLCRLTDLNLVLLLSSTSCAFSLSCEISYQRATVSVLEPEYRINGLNTSYKTDKDEFVQ